MGATVAGSCLDPPAAGWRAGDLRWGHSSHAGVETRIIRTVSALCRQSGVLGQAKPHCPAPHEQRQRGQGRGLVQGQVQGQGWRKGRALFAEISGMEYCYPSKSGITHKTPNTRRDKPPESAEALNHRIRPPQAEGVHCRAWKTEWLCMQSLKKQDTIKKESVHDWTARNSQE